MRNDCKRRRVKKLIKMFFSYLLGMLLNDVKMDAFSPVCKYSLALPILGMNRYERSVWKRPSPGIELFTDAVCNQEMD